MDVYAPTAPSETIIRSPSGLYIAEYGEQIGKWRISTATKRMISSRKRKEDAARDLSDLDGGRHKSQNKPQAATASTKSARIAANPRTSYAEGSNREGNWKAGTGRGNKLKRPPEGKLEAALGH